MAEALEESQVLVADVVGHELVERLGREPQALDFGDVAFGHRLDARGPGLVQHRLHDEERQKQGQADQHDVRRRALGAEGAAEQRQHDDDAGEGGHHDQQAGRERQHGDQGGELDDARGGAGLTGGAEIDVHRLRLGKRGSRSIAAAAEDALASWVRHPSNHQVLRPARQQDHLPIGALHEVKAAAGIERDGFPHDQCSSGPGGRPPAAELEEPVPTGR